MQVHELDALLKSRFRNVQMSHRPKVPEVPSFSTLTCKSCGWYLMFHTTFILGWEMGNKGAVTNWLMRHVSCK